MPQINLLPHAVKKKEIRDISVAGPKVEFLAAKSKVILRSSVCAGVVFLIWLPLFINIVSKERTLRRLQAEVSALTTSPEEIEKLKKERTALENKINLIKKLSSRNFLWFNELEFIAALIPNGVWLTDISSKEDSGPVKANPPGGGAAIVLSIKGTAVAYKIEDAVVLIKTFIDNLRNDKEFSKDFTNIRPTNIAKGIFAGLDVMRFELSCEMN